MGAILSKAPLQMTAPPLAAYGPAYSAAYNATNCPTFGIAYSTAFGVSYSSTYDTAFGITYSAAYDVAFCIAFLRVAITLRGCCYIVPHPMIYLVLKFEANRLKNDRVIEWAPF